MKAWLEIAIWVVCLPPMWGTLLWCFWEGSVRPRMIPRREILAEADRLWAQDRDGAFERVCIEEHAAWYRAEEFCSNRRGMKVQWQVTGPRRPRISPGTTSNVTSLTATNPPNLLVRLSTRRMGLIASIAIIRKMRGIRRVMGSSPA